jgi:hypothetical protein
VKEPPGYLGPFEGFVPRLPEINHRLATPVKNELAHFRCAVFLLDRPCCPPPFNQRPQFAVERKDSTLTVFRCSQPHFTSCPVHRIPSKWHDLASTPS